MTKHIFLWKEPGSSGRAIENGSRSNKVQNEVVKAAVKATTEMQLVVSSSGSRRRRLNSVVAAVGL